MFSTAPRVLIEAMHFTPIQLGLFFAGTVLIVFAAGMLATKLAPRFGFDRSIQIGLVAAAERLMADGKLGDDAFLRNISNMVRAGVSLVNIRAGLQSRNFYRQMPTQFLAAANEVESLLSPEFATRLRSNVEERLGLRLKILHHHRCRKSLKDRWRDAVTFARRIRDGEHAGAIKGATILASVSLLAFLFPHPIRAAESWRHCLGLGMNLMALGAIFATTPTGPATPPIKPFKPDAPKAKSSWCCCDCGSYCEGCDCCGGCCECCSC